MGTKHTKGEWLVKEHTPNSFKIVAPDKVSELARVYVDKRLHRAFSITLEEAEANAKLIASAPELLEALIKINGMIADSCTKDGVIINSGKIAEISINAIKKATE